MDHFTFDTQTLIIGCPLDEVQLRQAITDNFSGNSLIVGGDSELMKVHFHTNSPGKLIDYCITLGDIFDVVIENMDRQSVGEKG